ncbi:iron chelate uptake ABC transporter family permease subunit [Mesorhizobium sp. KR2-14]|uniref:iron chelate uptake ABC transporter family permease subunit n=1 Tax=Mesorhizobium sp. KR2-14 TaxID=3156610 RepID=UPI0032B44F8C
MARARAGPQLVVLGPRYFGRRTAVWAILVGPRKASVSRQRASYRSNGQRSGIGYVASCDKRCLLGDQRSPSAVRSPVGRCILAGVVTAFCGSIGFIGLAAPHLVRGILGQSDHFAVLPGSALVGAVLVLLAEYVAGGNGLTDVTLPLNSVTAFIGAPVVLWVLLRRRREAGQVPS